VTDTTGPVPISVGRPGQAWGRRAVQVIGGVLLLALAIAAVSIWWLDRSIDRVEVGGLGGSGAPGTAADIDVADASEARALTFLVLGSDSREDLTAEQRREFGTGDFDGARTEVISLVRLDPDAGEVRILNVPRDSRVERCDGSVGKINGAYMIGEADGRGGATCTVDTVSRLTGLTIDHVVIVDFAGFVDVVDGLGGVSMYLDEPLRDRGSHLDLPAGCVELDGVDALAFARARQLDDDFGRIARQQRLVSEIRSELAEVGVLDDLPRLLRVAEAVAGSVELDSSLDLGKLQQLVREHRRTLKGDLDGRAVPGELLLLDDISYVQPDEQRAAELARWLLTGDDPADDGSATTAAGAETDVAPAGETSADEEGEAPDSAGPSEGDGDDGRDEPNGPTTLSGEAPAGTDPGPGAESC
jgi:LCP family protein required for cell wall assembly